MRKNTSTRAQSNARPARRAQQEAEGTYQAPVYGGVKKVPSSRQNTQRKKEPPPVLTSKEKGFSLKTAFNKATWGINLAKAFAPKMELGARNRVKVGVRFRPLNASEEKRGDADKQKGFLTLEPVAGVVRGHPRPPNSARGEDGHVLLIS